MAHYNIVSVIKDGLLGVSGYQDVIESIRWGLNQLGHETTYSVNTCCDSAVNILFGGHLSTQLLVDSPPGTIYYNLEQLRGHPAYAQGDPLNTVKFITSNLRIWDYSGANIEVWEMLNPRFPVKHVPIGYAPLLTRIERAEIQDVDILIYGSVTDRRLGVFKSIGNLINIGISTVFASGLYAVSRDLLIARSKIVLNINTFERSKIFEIVRVSYLLANSKAVIADISPETYIESDIVDCTIFAPIERIVETCLILLGDNDRRTQLERTGFDRISKRDIREFIAAALA